MSVLEIRRLKAFGYQVRGDAARDLELLRDIETTLDALDIELERASQLNQAAEKFIELVKKSASSTIGDDTDLVALFDSARDTVGRAHKMFGERHQCALNAPELDDDDGIVEAYECLMSATATLHNNLNTLSWLIGEHEADLDETLPGAYGNADDLFSAMGV